MQKKLIAVAVASVLAAPVAALAQTSTVNIYGTMTYEYGFGDAGDNRPETDYADTPGGSAIGFRGEEKLGGGLSAWFQCESSADVRGMDQRGICTRNRPVGFKGGFGNLHFGRWDTPMKRALNQGTVGAEETGLMGMSFLPFGGSGGADATNSNDGPQRQRWKRRETGLVYYESPVFSGFQVLGAFSSGNFAWDSSAVDATPNPKPRVWSLAGTYSAGPLRIGLSYEKHAEFGAHQGSPASCGLSTAGVITCTASSQPTVALDDSAWGISAAYTFAGKVKVGGTYLDAEYETAPGRQMDKKTWTVGVEWNVAGPHTMAAQYASAGDTKGNSLVGISANGGLEASGPDTGGDAWSIAYRYAFSKRTSLRIAYVRVDNDTNSNTYRIGNSSSLLGNGQNVDSFAARIVHRF